MDSTSETSSGFSTVGASITNILINPTKKYYRKTAHRSVSLKHLSDNHGNEMNIK
ncbi:hypothetical protein QTP88_020492 [Uroleucon formosanum]